MKNNIRKLREAKGINQESLKRALGWSHQSRVSHYERGERIGSINECREIVAALNSLGIDCTLDDVFPPQDKAAA
jgi:putative transcriptional regulator